MALATSLFPDSFLRSSAIHACRSSTRFLLKAARMSRRWSAVQPLMSRSMSNTASIRRTASRHRGDITAWFLPRAFRRAFDLPRRQRYYATCGLRPDEAATVQPFGIERQSDPVMPKGFDQRAALATEHIYVSGEGISSKTFLHLQSQAMHATAHIGMARGDPHAPGTGIIRATPPTHAAMPPATHHCRPADAGHCRVRSRSRPVQPWIAWMRWGRCGRRGQCRECTRGLDHVHGQKRRNLGLGPQHALAHLAPPREQQALAQAVPDGHTSNTAARLLRLSDKAQLLSHTPTPTPLAPGDDLHHPIHPITSTSP